MVAYYNKTFKGKVEKERQEVLKTEVQLRIEAIEKRLAVLEQQIRAPGKLDEGDKAIIVYRVNNLSTDNVFCKCKKGIVGRVKGYATDHRKRIVLLGVDKDGKRWQSVEPVLLTQTDF